MPIKRVKSGWRPWLRKDRIQRERTLEQHFRNAVREFVFTTVRHINFYTGMSRATLLPLAQEVAAVQAVTDMLRHATVEGKRYWNPQQPHLHGQPQDIHLGVEAGQNVYELEIGDDIKFEIKLDQLPIQYRVQHPHAIEAGMDAMRKYFRDNSIAQQLYDIHSVW